MFCPDAGIDHSDQFGMQHKRRQRGNNNYSCKLCNYRFSLNHTIEIRNNAFDPKSLTIKVGDTVIWRNRDSHNHTVTGDKDEFDSDTMSSGGEFSHTFGTAGTFAYKCAIHTTMTGEIIVKN